MREKGIFDMNFLDAKDARFQDLRKTLDARLKELTSREICQASRSLISTTLEGPRAKPNFKFFGAH